MAYAVLFKKTGLNSYQGATLVKKNVTLAKLKAFLKANTRKGYTTKIITQAQLKTALKKRITKRKTPTKRKVVRRNKK